MIDNKTPRLQLPKPDPDNYLDDDVVRLQQALDILDSAATVGDDGKIPDEQIPTRIARRDSPTFTGIPKSPTALADDSSTQIANTKFVADAVSKAKSDISGDVPDDLSTLEKLALAIANNPEFAQVVSDAIALRAMKGENSDITSLSGLTTPLSTQQGGTGSTSPFGTTAGKFCQGNDSRLGTIEGKSGGKVTGSVTTDVEFVTQTESGAQTAVLGGGRLELIGTTPFVDFHFNSSGDDYDVRMINDNAGTMTLKRITGPAKFSVIGGYSCRAGLTGVTGGNQYNYFWTGTALQVWIDGTNVGTMAFNSSDIELKIKGDDVTDTASALSEVIRWKPSYYKYRARGAIAESEQKLGFIANSLKDISPDCVSGDGLPVGSHNDLSSADIGKAYNIEPHAMIAKLTLAVQEMQKKITSLELQLSER